MTIKIYDGELVVFEGPADKLVFVETGAEIDLLNVECAECGEVDCICEEDENENTDSSSDSSS